MADASCDVPSSEVRRHLSEHLDRVLGGESFTVSRHGRPIAELRPVSPEEINTDDD
jgi:prevent-host-death family protein